MDSDAFSNFMDLLSKGGSASMVLIVYVCWQAARTARRAADNLEKMCKQIETDLPALRTTTADTNERVKAMQPVMQETAARVVYLRNGHAGPLPPG